MNTQLRMTALAVIVLSALLALLAFSVFTARADDAGGDRAALLAIYQATGGGDWAKNKNWGTDRPLSRWHGVTVDGSGRVVNLDLRRNKLSGTLPPEIGDLSALRTLNLVGNKLNGPLPPQIGRLHALTKLDLTNNRLSGPIPEELGHLLDLKRLRLNSNRFTGSLPFDRTAFPNLGTLRIRSNNLVGCIPDHMQDISKNDFASSGLENCPDDGDRAALMALYDVTVGVDWSETGGWDTGAPVDQWHGVTVDGAGRVSRLNLTGNRLHGPLPAELGGLTRLSELRLVDNSLTGSIPGELADLPALRVLWLADNYFSGCIPEGLRDVRDNDLDQLDLEDCVPPEPEPEGKPGVAFSPRNIVSVEEGGQSEFTVVLTGEPTADVTVEVGRNVPASALTLSPSLVTFTPENWNVPKTVTVAAEPDPDTDGGAYVFLPVSQSDDERYSDRWWHSYAITITNDE